MLIYEVTSEVEGVVAEAWLTWIRPHAQAVVEVGGFTGWRIEERVDGTDPARRTFVVRYQVPDAGALDAYLRDHAPALRADAEQHFGGRFRASRRVLREVV